jgi:flagellar biosynthesis chaperone FliJ
VKQRFDTLVKIQKEQTQKFERQLKSSFTNVQNASNALVKAQNDLNSITIPQSGSILNMLQAKELQNAQKRVLDDKKEWLKFAQEQLSKAKESLKTSQLELEKYKYLQNQEIQKELKRIKLVESKQLDEIALMTYMKHKKDDEYAS